MRLSARLDKAESVAQAEADRRYRAWFYELMTSYTGDQLRTMCAFLGCVAQEGLTVAEARYDLKRQPWYPKLVEGYSLASGGLIFGEEIQRGHCFAVRRDALRLSLEERQAIEAKRHLKRLGP